MQALCTVEDACKKVFQHPCIAAFTGGGDVEYFIICEQSVASKISGFQNALFTLFSTYYVYHLAYPPQASNVFYFLQDYILARPDCGKRSGSYQAVVSDIKQNIWVAKLYCYYCCFHCYYQKFLKQHWSIPLSFMTIIITAKWSEKQYINGENIELSLSILTQGWIIINHPCMNIDAV